MNALVAVWRRLFPPSDGTICGLPRLFGCETHRRLGWVCRCLELEWHRGGHECGQGARWPDGRSGT